MSPSTRCFPARAPTSRCSISWQPDSRSSRRRSAPAASRRPSRRCTSALRRSLPVRFASFCMTASGPAPPAPQAASWRASATPGNACRRISGACWHGIGRPGAGGRISASSWPPTNATGNWLSCWNASSGRRIGISRSCSSIKVLGSGRNMHSPRWTCTTSIPTSRAP